MPSWNADQYLRFAEERTRPVHDLVARIALEAPRTIIDLGCGPGNSTAVLADRWPDAEIAGLDSARAMIDAARAAAPNGRWQIGDIARWADEGRPQDLVFSNAALQWVPDHDTLLPGLMRRVAAGGALALQVPADPDAPAHRIMRDVAGSARWRSSFPAAGVREWFVHDPGFYYDHLAAQAAHLDLWQTEYLHILDGAAGIVSWYQGTGLRPFLDALPDEPSRAEFLADYGREISIAFPLQADGRVLFPFKRLFIIAYR